jgi:hypothetical protein
MPSGSSGSPWPGSARAPFVIECRPESRSPAWVHKAQAGLRPEGDRGIESRGIAGDRWKIVGRIAYTIVGGSHFKNKGS